MGSIFDLYLNCFDYERFSTIFATPRQPWTILLSQKQFASSSVVRIIIMFMRLWAGLDMELFASTKGTSHWDQFMRQHACFQVHS
jgi:hypothetical protein